MSHCCRYQHKDILCCSPAIWKQHRLQGERFFLATIVVDLCGPIFYYYFFFLRDTIIIIMGVCTVNLHFVREALFASNSQDSPRNTPDSQCFYSKLHRIQTRGRMLYPLTLMMQAGSVMKPGRIEQEKRYYMISCLEMTRFRCIIKTNQTTSCTVCDVLDNAFNCQQLRPATVV